MTEPTTSHETIREYYGRVLTSTKDLKTGACCPSEAAPPELLSVLPVLKPAVLDRFYGCGSPIPPALDGAVVLDLGCGTGRDAFVCAKLVGENGLVIGLDMTEAQIEVARASEADAAKEFGYAAPNTRFVSGYMEDLAAAGIEDESVDVVISNCVVNLSPNKERVFREILRVLKPGGEILFADVFADRRLPAGWREDPVLLGECLAGAMYTEDFRRLLYRLGVPDYRVVTERPLPIEDKEIAAKVGPARFFSVTVRAFKIADLEDRCEDYGHVVRYLGTVPFAPQRFELEGGHVFETGRPMPVCGNTAAMLTETRLAPHFEVTGGDGPHAGLFPCGPAAEPQEPREAEGADASCC